MLEIITTSLMDRQTDTGAKITDEEMHLAGVVMRNRINEQRAGTVGVVETIRKTTNNNRSVSILAFGQSYEKTRRTKRAAAKDRAVPR